jgi:hypothetical protein
MTRRGGTRRGCSVVASIDSSVGHDGEVSKVGAVFAGDGGAETCGTNSGASSLSVGSLGASVTGLGGVIQGWCKRGPACGKGAGRSSRG